MSWDTEQSNFTTNIVGIDPRADWLLTDSQSDFAKNEDFLIPFIVQIKDDLPSQVVGELVQADQIYVSSWYLTQETEIQNKAVRYPKPGTPFVAYAGRRFFELLANAKDDKSALISLGVDSLRVAAKSIDLRTPLLTAQPAWLSTDNSRRALRTNAGINQLETLDSQSTSWPRGTVIMAVIDDGIPIANTQFQNSAGTRIEYFWRQDGPTPSSTVPNGTELTKQDINNLLLSSEVAGVVDEDTFYAQAGLASYNEPGAAHKSVAWRASHGAHVMDIATGFAKEQDVKNRPIIAVQLPANVVENTSGSELDQHAIDAIDYILQRAELMSPNEPLPLVINLSFGQYSGPHDGTSALELYLDSIVNSRDNTRIVLPAGNNRQARCHSVITKSDFTQQQGEVTLNWRVQPDDKTHSYMHIWMPADTNFNPPASDRIKISVVAPNGEQSAELGEVLNQNDLVYSVGGQTVCRVGNTFVDGDTNRSLFTLSMMPTARNYNISSMADVKPTAPAGVWKVVIKDINVTETTEINCWVERDDTAYGYQSQGRQSYFDDPDYQRYDDYTAPVEVDTGTDSTTKRSGTLNGIATGDKVIVVGGMYRKEKSLTNYSACGPASARFGSAVATREGPDLLTVSDDSKVHAGIPGAGTRSGSVMYFSGTSVAAPRVAREVADLLAAGAEADRNHLSAIVSAQEPLDGDPATTPAKQCGGSGRWALDHPHTRLHRFDSDSVGIT